MARHIPIGDPVNAGEERVIEYLKTHLPDDYLLLTNFSLTQSNQTDLEYDAVVVGQYAVYVLEIKDYDGEIRGDRFQWELPARKPGGEPHTVPSPIEQVGRQVRVLVGRLRNISNHGAVFVHGLVCLAGKDKPVLQLAEDPARLQRVSWYKGIENLLTDKAKVPVPNWRVTELDPALRSRVITAVRTGAGAQAPRRGGLRLGRYWVRETAWASTRYEAYFATHNGASPDQYLLKVYSIPPDIAADEISKFITKLERDLSALRQIRDRGQRETGGAQNVVIGYEAFPLREQSKYVIAMEWVDGHLLSSFMQTDGPALSLREKYEVAAQLCRGLAFAHSANVVHRNLNPDNVILAQDGLVKIINFDFARFLKPTSVDTRKFDQADLAEVEKSARYWAPELQIASQNPDNQKPGFVYHEATQASDVYALGVILWELFSGTVHTSGKTIDLTTLQANQFLDEMVTSLVRSLCNPSVDGRRVTSLTEIANAFERLAHEMESRDVSMPTLGPGSLFKKYRVDKRISDTPMSVVYLAQDTIIELPVIIKFLRAGSLLQAQAEMKRARRVLRQIDPGVTSRWEEGDSVLVSKGRIVEHDPRAHLVYYQVMEYLPGESLKSLLKRSLPSTAEAVRIALGVTRAVSAVHQAGWTHRDIKPENFVVTDTGQVKIIDFGLSKGIEDGRQAEGISPGYTPPEVQSSKDQPGQPWSYAGDVFSTACVIASLFGGESNGPQNGPALDWALIQQRAGARLTKMLEQDVNPDPEARHTNAMEMLAALEQAIQPDEDSSREGHKPMNKSVYQAIVNQLQQKAADFESRSDFEEGDRYLRAATALQAWLNDGHPGQPPIDLEKDFEIVWPTASPQSPETLPTIVEEASVEPVETIEPVEAAEPVATDRMVEPDTTVELLDNTFASEETAPEKPEAEPIDEIPDLTPPPSLTPNETVVYAEPPEQARLKTDYGMALQHFNKNELRQAVALSEQVAGQAVDPKLKADAVSLNSQARRKLNTELERLNKEGDAARSKKLVDKARQFYNRARDLDPENDHARRALLELDNVLAGRLTEQDRNKLRSGLNNRKDLKRLGDAVYQAEALEADGKLPGELKNLLKAARAAYDEIRKAQGQETTLMRFGDLAGRKIARDKIADRVAALETVILDLNINQLRPANEVLFEADRRLEEGSEDTAQYEIDIINRALPASPRWAKQRLDKALTQPFHEKHRRLLLKLEDEIQKLIDNQTAAESLLIEAGQNNDPVKIYELVSRAQAAFPHISGLSERVTRSRQTALDTLIAHIRSRLNQAGVYLKIENYQSARAEVTQAEISFAQWPEPQKPDELLTQQHEASELRHEIEEREVAHNDLLTQIADIRSRVLDPNNRMAGLQLFKRVHADPRFAVFSELAVLVSEMDQYRDISEQLAEARAARAAGNWMRLRELAETIQRSGKAGQFGAEVDNMLAQATLELEIGDVQALLAQDKITAANRILSGRMKGAEANPDLHTALEKRLQRELSLISQCSDDDPPMRELIQQAAAKADRRRSLPDRLEALRLYRYVGGEMVEDAPAHWPPYRLSFQTDLARTAANSLGTTLRDELLEPMLASRETNLETMSDADLQYVAERARALRQANLLDNEDERTAARRVEVEWGRRVATAKEATGDWDAAVKEWEELDLHHPRLPQVETGLTNAREHQEAIERALIRAQTELGENRPRDALLTLQNAIAKDLTRNSPKLIRERDLIFNDVEAALLRTADTERNKGSDEGKIHAVVAMVDLRELEDVVGWPEPERRSTQKLEALRTELANVAETVARSAQQFNPALLPLADALNKAHELADRLQSFSNVARMFGTELGPVKERLDQRQRQINEVLEKLNRLQATLETNQPPLWDSALRTSNFDTLNRIQTQIQEIGLSALPPEALQFQQRLAEYKDIQAFLIRELNEIHRLFVDEEEFDRVVPNLRRLKSRPETRPTQQPWQHIQQKEYEAIYRIMNDLLRISDIFGSDLEGWEQVERAAMERSNELEPWEVWDQSAYQLMEKAQQAWDITQNHETVPNLQITQKKWDWESVRTTSQAAVRMLEAGPQHDGQPISVHSAKAKSFADVGKGRLKFAKAWLDKAELELATIEDGLQKRGFPKAEEFSDAATLADWNRLQQLLDRANMVGAADDRESKQIKVYTQVLENARQPKKKGWFNLR